MRNEVDFNQAVKNGVQSIREEAEFSFTSLGILAERHLATARFLGNERAVRYWHGVVSYCRLNGIA